MQTDKDTASIHSRSDALQMSDLLRFVEQKDQLIADSDQAIADRKKAILEHKHIIEEKQKLLKKKLRLAMQKHFDSSSEKLPFKVVFFDEAELEQALSDVEAQLQETEKPPAETPRRKRKGFSVKLQHARVELQLSEEEKEGASQTFFTKVKDEFEIIRAQARILEYWQVKAVFHAEDRTKRILSASRPAHPLGKCIDSVQLLAYILVAKYADALPLYRLEKILKRYGPTTSRNKMANWIIGLEKVFNPLIKLIREHQIRGDHLQKDETRSQVLKKQARWRPRTNGCGSYEVASPTTRRCCSNANLCAAKRCPCDCLRAFKACLS